MTRHSLGYLLSERAKAQKQIIPISDNATNTTLPSDVMVETPDFLKEDIQDKTNSECTTEKEIAQEKQTLSHPPNNVIQ